MASRVPVTRSPGAFPIYDGATQCLGDRSDPRDPANDWFPSGNVGAYPPTGALTRPAAGATVTIGDNPLIDVTANATDDVRVAAVRIDCLDQQSMGGDWTSGYLAGFPGCLRLGCKSLFSRTPEWTACRGFTRLGS